MLSQLCGYLRNWFEMERYLGRFKIAGGVISPLFSVAEYFLLDGQYIRIVGSILNDGIYQYHAGQPIEGLRDEEFDGAVWSLAIPADVVALDKEIEDWRTANEKAAGGLFSSENLSAGSYSYSKTSGAAMADLTWQRVFAPKLDQWRKI